MTDEPMFTPLSKNEVPSDFMEGKAFYRNNDEDWRRENDRNVNADAVQRSIAISLKRIADMMEEDCKTPNPSTERNNGAC